jgi:multimeric flavodoxin WrbA
MKILIAQMSSYLGNVEKNLKKMVEIIESAIEADISRVKPYRILIGRTCLRSCY